MGMELGAAMEFVSARSQGVLVTVKRDGRPQLSNILYSPADDGAIEISVTDSRAKTVNLRRDPRTSLYVLGDNFWSYVVVEGGAELTPVAAAPHDPTVERLVAMYVRISGEHPDWDEYRRVMVEERRLLVRLRPERAYGMVS